MPFSIRPYHRFPVQCSVTYNAGPFQGQGTVWNLSCTGWRLSGDVPMRPGEILSLTVTLPNEQCIEVPQAVVRWSRGQESAVENLAIKPHTRARLQHYVKRFVQGPVEIIPLVTTTPNAKPCPLRKRPSRICGRLPRLSRYSIGRNPYEKEANLWISSFSPDGPT